MITIQWSKTIQFGERTLVILLVSIADTPLCPVQAYLNIQSLVCFSDDSPAYCFVKHKQIYPIIYRQFQSVLKQMIRDIGENPDVYSTHSFRKWGVLVGHLLLKYH